MLTRRGLLLGGTAVTAATLAGCSTWWHPMDGSDEPDDEQPDDVAPDDLVRGEVVHGELVSQARLGHLARWALVRPPGPRQTVPLVVALHGFGGSTAVLVGPDWDLPGALARAVRDGCPPFAIAVITGGNTFWHPRPSGEDAGAMVTDEFLPLLDERRDELGIDPDTLGLLGWSMGGYGVLRLAPILGADRVRAVVASSPGLWTDPALALPEGFADPAEYEKFSVMDNQSDLAGIPLKIDVGISDDFAPAVATYLAGFPEGADVTSSFGEGDHSLAYSLGVLPSELAFLGDHLE